MPEEMPEMTTRTGAKTGSIEAELGLWFLVKIFIMRLFELPIYYLLLM